MRNTLVIFGRDVGAYFFSPMAYIVLFLFLLTNGVLFYIYTQNFASNPQQITHVVEELFGFNIFWVLPLSPLLTMRLFAEEKRTGSMELLMTAPVREWEVVLGKFLAAQTFYAFIWLSILPLILILHVLGNGLDWGPVIAIYVGLFSLGLLTNSLGLLASAGTRNQLISAILALTGNLFFLILAMGPALFPGDPDVRRLFSYVSFTSHFSEDFSRGLVDLRFLLYYLSFTVFFLFFCTRVVEARKWR